VKTGTNSGERAKDNKLYNETQERRNPEQGTAINNGERSNNISGSNNTNWELQR